ncbi:MAG: hypothetical protein Kow0068_26100 [Marinilabiliales bacterium]
MDIVAVVLLILLGVILVLLEFLVFPGVTVAGIAGTLFIAAGVYYSYSKFGYSVGNYTLAGSIVFVLLVIIYALRGKTWKKVALDTAVDSKVNTIEDNKIKPGDTGVCVSRLAPMGKVLINGEYYEAKSYSNFIDHKTEIVVVKIENGKLIVKPINN